MLSRFRPPQERGAQLPSGICRGHLVRLAAFAPVILVIVAVAALTILCRGLLVDASAGRPVAVGTLPVVLVAGGFLLASGSLILLQSFRIAARVAGPEHRLAQALQRIRTGDIAFRVHLRRGDLLSGLARECNELLDWMNANPPPGASTGGDIVEVEAEEPAHAELVP